MIRFFKALYSLPSELAAIRDEISLLRLLIKKPESREETMVRLTRHNLGSLDTADFPEDVPENVTKFNNTTGPLFKEVIEPKLKRMIRAQERYTSVEALDMAQVAFGRGSINGLELVREAFEDAYAAFEQSKQPKETFDEHTPLPEI